MTDEIPRKWEYIADQLTMLDAPIKVHNAAIEIDVALTKLDLDDVTQDWREDFSNYTWTIDLGTLHSIITNEYYCTPCVDCCMECCACKLGDLDGCTPRVKFADNYFSIVRRWVERQINHMKAILVNEANVPRKWEYIAARLKELNAPEKVVNAAVEIDNAIVKLGLGNHTCEWKSLYHKYTLTQPHVNDLFFDIVMNSDSCTACEEVDGMCSICQLGNWAGYTPRSKFADDYFTIVRRWFLKHFANELY